MGSLLRAPRSGATENASATRRRVLDPELPHLPAVVDLDQARAHWGSSAGWLSRPLADDIELVAVHSVRWDPARSCQVVYETREHAAGRPAAASFVVLEITPDGATWHRLQDDPDLPVARLLEDPDLPDRLASLGGRLDRWTALPVRYRPGSRCVVRFDLATAKGVRHVYAKLLRGGSSELAAAMRSLGRAGPADGTSGHDVLVPPILAEWDELGVVVSAEAPGSALSEILRDETVPVARRVRLAGALGGLLAQVHAVRELPAGIRTAEDEISDVADCLAPAWSADPVAAPMAAGLVASLGSAAPQTASLVVSHGAFRAGQVHACLRGTPPHRPELRLLDLDSVCWSDPGLDLGNAWAYLTWQGVRDARQRTLSRRLATALVLGYLDAGGPADLETLAWWRAAAMAKIAARRYRSLATAEWPAVPGLLRLARAVLESPPDTGGRPRRSPRAGTVAELLDPRAMTSVLRPALSRQAGMGARPRVLDVQVLASVGGRRAVVRCTVAGGRPGTVLGVIAKVHADASRAAVAYDNQQRFHQGLRGRDVSVPEPLGLVPDRAMVIYRAVDGVPVLDVAPADRPAAVEAAGAALRALHCADARLSRTLDTAAESAAVQTWAALVGRHVPAVAAPAAQLGSRLHRELARAPVVPHVPVHKDFHPAHVLLGSDGTAVVDVDEARMGDPALDVAHFLVHLDATRWPELEAAHRAFWRGYGVLGGAEADRRLALFQAWAGLKLARQVVAGSAPEAGPDPNTVTDVLGDLLAKASSWLGT